MSLLYIFLVVLGVVAILWLVNISTIKEPVKNFLNWVFAIFLAFWLLEALGFWGWAQSIYF